MSSTSLTGFDVELKGPYDQAIETVTAALKEEGFGVLTTIDVTQTLKAKLGVDVEPYTILGACNPGLAHRALQAAPQVGLLLPCNVTVRAHGGGILVSIVDPEQMLAVAGEHPELNAVASEAADKLRKVAAQLRSSADAH